MKGKKMIIHGGKFMALSGHGFEPLEMPLQVWQTVRKLLRGAVVTWEDAKPLYEVGTVLRFNFDTRTRVGADMYIGRAIGASPAVISDRVSRLLVGLQLQWRVRVELVYTYKNRERDDRAMVRPIEFTFKGTINPICADFIDKRDKAFLAAQLSEAAVPDDSKNKGEYLTTRFTLTLL